MADVQQVLQSLHKHGVAVLPASFITPECLEAMRCESSALLEQSKSLHCQLEHSSRHVAEQQ